MSKNTAIVILAAGEGRRMRSALPKVLHEISGRPMIRRVIDTAKNLNPKKIVAVIAKKQPQVKDAAGPEAEVVYQERQLGTADAMKAAMRRISADIKNVVVLYGDVPLIRPETVSRLSDIHLSAGAPATVLSMIADNPCGYGRILRNSSGEFSGIVEEKDADAGQRLIREVNTGIYCFRRLELEQSLKQVRPLNKAGEYYLTDCIGWFLDRGKKISTFLTDDSDEAMGINSQKELRRAQDIFRSRILERHIQAGVRVMDFKTVFIDETVHIGAGTRVFPFVFIEEGVSVGKNCSLGPFCHLRPGAVLADNCSVGNFTEIKNSTLAQGVFMRHVSYLGDTTVGEDANIGAGTVVANFDGRKKNRTIIKDKAFIGCDSVLIAPVTIGKNAVVGAGSVVTKNHNVCDGATVVGVPAREMVNKSKELKNRKT